MVNKESSISNDTALIDFGSIGNGGSYAAVAFAGRAISLAADILEALILNRYIFSVVL